MTNIRIHQRGPVEQRTLAILRDCLRNTCCLHWPHQMQHAAVLWQQSTPTHNPASSAEGSCSHVAPCWAQSNDELLSESTCRHQGTAVQTAILSPFTKAVAAHTRTTKTLRINAANVLAHTLASRLERTLSKKHYAYEGHH